MCDDWVDWGWFGVGSSCSPPPTLGCDECDVDDDDDHEFFISIFNLLCRLCIL